MTFRAYKKKTNVGQTFKIGKQKFFLLKTNGKCKRRPRSPFRTFLIEIAIGKRKVGRNAKVRFFPLSAAARSTERGGGQSSPPSLGRGGKQPCERLRRWSRSWNGAVVVLVCCLNF